MRAAQFDVSTDLLANLLKLPETATIIGASFKAGPHAAVTLVVDDPSLSEADAPQPCEPTVTGTQFHWEWNLRSSTLT